MLCLLYSPSASEVNTKCHRYFCSNPPASIILNYTGVILRHTQDIPIILSTENGTMFCTMHAYVEHTWTNIKIFKVEKLSLVE